MDTFDDKRRLKYYNPSEIFNRSGDKELNNTGGKDTNVGGAVPSDNPTRGIATPDAERPATKEELQAPQDNALVEPVKEED